METGIAAIDEDHRELVRHINELGQAMRRGEGRTRISELLGFLSEYADKHFAAEEKLMEESGFPGALEHRGRHEQFRKDLKTYEDAFAKGTGERAATLDLHGWVMNWLSAHTLYEDDQFVQFLRDRTSR
jgi:hemerythrin-like metal-binding protein